MDNQKKAKFLKRAMKHPYLSDDLETIAKTDGKEVQDYTLTELVDEANYCLSLYNESGHINNPNEYDLDDPERKSLLKEKQSLSRLCWDFAEFASGEKWGIKESK